MSAPSWPNWLITLAAPGRRRRSPGSAAVPSHGHATRHWATGRSARPRRLGRRRPRRSGRLRRGEARPRLRRKLHAVNRTNRWLLPAVLAILVVGAILGAAVR